MHKFEFFSNNSIVKVYFSQVHWIPCCLPHPWMFWLAVVCSPTRGASVNNQFLVIFTNITIDSNIPTTVRFLTLLLTLVLTLVIKLYINWICQQASVAKTKFITHFRMERSWDVSEPGVGWRSVKGYGSPIVYPSFAAYPPYSSVQSVSRALETGSSPVVRTTFGLHILQTNPFGLFSVGIHLKDRFYANNSPTIIALKNNVRTWGQENSPTWDVGHWTGSLKTSVCE